MDLSARLALWRESALRHLPSAQRYLPPAACAALGLVVAYELSTLTWIVVAGPKLAPAAIAASPPTWADGGTAAGGDGVAGARLSGAHLFGTQEPEAGPAPSRPIETAPTTTLTLRLSGVLFTEAGGPSQVIIGSGSADRLYAIGDPIEGAGDAKLYAVLADRAVLERDGGRLETLWLPKVAREGGASSPPAIAAASARARDPSPVWESPIPDATHPSVAEQGNRPKVDRTGPPPLTQIASVAPVSDDESGATYFNLNPGPDGAAFGKLGLTRGDRVVSVNGIELGDDARKGVQIFNKALAKHTSASLTVMRNGSYETVIIDSNLLAVR